MALVGLKRAAELTGKNQSTIHRAMKAGRLSYSQSDSGERLIDTAELHRLFPIKAEGGLRDDAPEEQRKDVQAAAAAAADWRAQIALLQQRIDGLEADKADLREDRDHWRAQAELATRLLTDQRSPKRRKWWSWGRDREG
jgi:hypothetical protein